MALTKAQVREILSSAGVAAENVAMAVEKIMDGHLASIEALREERDGYKADAEKLPSVQKELDDLKAKGDQNWQEKFTNEHQAFEDYKKQVDAEKVKAQKTELYKQLLKDAKIADKRIDSILKVTDLDALKVKDGKLDDVDNLKKAVEAEWSEFIMEPFTKGAKVDNPPAQKEQSAFEKMSLAEKMKYANEHPTDQSVIDWLKT